MRGYGYQRDKVTVIEDEAAIIREAARRVLSSEAVRAVAADLNARGIVTVPRKQRTTTSLSAVLTGARITGRREANPAYPYTGHTRHRNREITYTQGWQHCLAPA